MLATVLAQEQQPPTKEENPNFLLPNATIIVEIIIFAVALYILWKYIVPPITKAMRERAEMVQRSAEESRSAEEKFRLATERYDEALNEARSEAARIRDTARAEGQRNLDELRERASTEIADLRRQSAEQLEGERERVLADLEPSVRGLAVDLATRVVGEDVTVRKGRRR
jgi:F-type H+-transporting ATPase subunit b